MLQSGIYHTQPDCFEFLNTRFPCRSHHIYSQSNDVNKTRWSLLKHIKLYSIDRSLVILKIAFRQMPGNLNFLTNF